MDKNCRKQEELYKREKFIHYSELVDKMDKRLVSLYADPDQEFAAPLITAYNRIRDNAIEKRNQMRHETQS